MTRMAVGIDGGGLLRPDTGIGRYTRELIRSLGGLGDAPELTILLNSFRSGRPPTVPADLPGTLVNPRLPHRVLHGLWRGLGWPPVETLAGPLDVFHTSDWSQPPLRSAARVTTVHDVCPLVRPDWYAPDVVERHREMARRSAEAADRVITVSEFTRGEILRLFDLDPDRVRAVPNGVARDFRAPAPERGAVLRRSVGVEGPFLLFVGTREPRKNLVGLVDVFRRVVDSGVDADLRLVVAGMRPWAEGRRVQGVSAWSGREVEERVEALGLGERVLFPGQVSLDVLRALYAGAEAFLFPTLYEGFGLPALEAMACGAPVVASDRTAVPEVVGDAGLLADPEDADGFARQVVRVLREAGLAASLRKKGLARAAAYGWDRTAHETLELYREAADRS